MPDNADLIINVLEKTDPELAAEVNVSNSFAQYLRRQGARVTLYRKYEAGEHRSGMTDQMRKMLRLKTDSAELDDLNDNYCEIVIDKMSSRIRVSEISVGEDDTATSWLTNLLRINKWDKLQAGWWRGAVRDSDSYIMIDPETLAWSSEPTYDGYSGIVAIMGDASSTPIWACKVWSESDVTDVNPSGSVMRIIVYQPGLISYWVGKDSSGEVLEWYVENQPAPTAENPDNINTSNTRPWPLTRIPIVSAINKHNNYTKKGDSEIRKAIPLQDSLNRTIYSTIMASELSAFRIIWSKGIAIDVKGIAPGAVLNLLIVDPETGKPVEVTPELVEYMKSVEVGQFGETNIQYYISQIKMFVEEISQTTQTPIYGITASGNLSGEALKQLEVGLVSKVEGFQSNNGDAVVELIELTAEIQNGFLRSSDRVKQIGPPPTNIDVSLSWKPAEVLDTSKSITTLLEVDEKNPGLFTKSFYRRKIGGLLGMSSSEIQKESEAADNELSDNLDRLIGAGGGIPVV